MDGTGSRERTRDTARILALVRRVYAERWLGHLRFWNGAKLAVGPMRIAVGLELLRLCQEELQLADMLAERIFELDGTLVTEPAQWLALSPGASVTPDNDAVTRVIEHALETEAAAIQSCRELLRESRGVDPVTYEVTLRVLEVLVEHDESLESLRRGVDAALEEHG